MIGYKDDTERGFWTEIRIIIAVVIGGLALSLLIVWLFVRNTPNSYEYCSSGWNAICIKSPTKLIPDKNGCVQNDRGRLCQYEVTYGQY